ncbi:hypothetical protein L1049_022731 [Liquidambar formosana]|uniref:Growth-regulating factor n=1 Tax=Liquidambar formosana TaxID=63359 RepID=A0AAP0RCW0_LIQFO
MSGQNRFPFTASQWQELEHQALIFKYMVSGMPIPSDLLFSIKRSMDASPLSSKLFPHQSQHIGWNCFQMGLGRKVDPEPGRCRRTDGKKWRCSKEAYPDSKYCERHMHRGKNRSRKPVEILTTPTPTPTTAPPPTTNPSIIPPILSITKDPSATLTPSNLTSRSLSSFSSITTDTHNNQHHDHPSCYNNTHLHHPFYYPHSSSSRPPGISFSAQDNTTHLHLDSASYSHTDPDYRHRYIHGLKEEVDEHAFFSETSGTMRSYSGSSMDDSCQLKPLTMSSSLTKQSCSGLQSGYSYLQLQSLTDTSKQHKQDQHHCYILGSDIKCEMPFKIEREDEPQKTVHRFFDEWPPKNRDSWLNLDDRSSNCASMSTTQLSISIPTSSHDFPIFNSRTQNNGD